MPHIFIIAGEASGDVLGARLMNALKLQRPDLTFSGIGGARMAEAGLTSLFPMQELAVMGLAEILPRIIPLRRRMQQTIAAITTSKPDILVTIDSPGFCLRVLKAVAPTGIKRIHYVAPQVWAWRQERVKHFPGLWDELLCLLPFEPDFFAPFGLNPVFVGHPVLESGADQGDAARFRQLHNIAPTAIPIMLMPGSRVTETKRLLPVFRETIALLHGQMPNILPVLAAASGIADAVASQTADWPVQPIIVRDVAERYDAFAAARAALTKSGTSTLELAMAGVSMAVTYRVNALSAAIGRRLIKVKYVAMINLLANGPLVPELLQENCTPPKLAATLQTLLTNPTAAETQRQGFKSALATLQAPATLASTAAAQAVVGWLRK
ncbi:MAG: lipid-A-disaccharide synthase [Acidocella sp. 20-57-95]|nr:MAG: lipid-A-disaccharide synthase [Acidocella sp. 20-57-95]OYV58510.1 MAG: lipid-A-disaccharide synthase [Acidocella sp. 21-58-7]HQT65174.1 lipid-A-disaccharide synthase [Acidocella sp.]HQU04625.1 lipid-A-disaccharide synthase [Acidocella sp.]